MYTCILIWCLHFYTTVENFLCNSRIFRTVEITVLYTIKQRIFYLSNQISPFQESRPSTKSSKQSVPPPKQKSPVKPQPTTTNKSPGKVKGKGHWFRTDLVTQGHYLISHSGSLMVVIFWSWKQILWKLLLLCFRMCVNIWFQ